MSLLILNLPPSAICRFDTVPYQDVHSPIQIGVLAYHMSGIDRVEFVETDGTGAKITTTVNEESWQNQFTNPIWNYNYTFDPTNWPVDSEILILAKAFPVKGGKREQKLTMFARPSTNGDTVYIAISGSDTTGDGTSGNPWRTVSHAVEQLGGRTAAQKDACTIIFGEAGTYSFTRSTISPNLRDNQVRWKTFKPADGLEMGDVVLDCHGNPAAIRDYLVSYRPTLHSHRFYKMAFDYSHIAVVYPDGGSGVWFDTCLFMSEFEEDFEHDGIVPRTVQTLIRKTQITRGAPIEPRGELVALDNFSEHYGKNIGGYATDSIVYRTKMGLDMPFQRDCKHIIFRGDMASAAPRTILNCEVFDHHTSSTGSPHADVIQTYRGNSSSSRSDGVNNMVVYGVKTYKENSQQIFLQSIDDAPNSINPSFRAKLVQRDMAFVNCCFAGTGKNKAAFNQLIGYFDHILFYHMTFQNKLILFRTSSSGSSRFRGRNVIFRNCALMRVQGGSGGDDLTISANLVQFFNCHQDILLEAFSEKLQGKIGSYGDPMYEDVNFSYDYTPKRGSPLRHKGAPIPGMKLPAEEVGGDVNHPHIGAWKTRVAASRSRRETSVQTSTNVSAPGRR